MKVQKIVLFSSILALGVFADTYVSDHSAQANQVSQHWSSHKPDSSLGNRYEKTLSQTNWQGTKVYDAQGNDLTKENSNFIGLAKYDNKTGYYEFLIR